MSLFFPLVFPIVWSLNFTNFTNISENIYGLWKLCLQGEKLNHDEEMVHPECFDINPVLVPTRYSAKCETVF